MVDTPHPTQLIEDELIARGWTADQLAIEMAGGEGEEAGKQRLVLDLYFEIGPDDTNMRLGEETTLALSRAFSVNPQFLRNLELAWLQSKGVSIS